LNRGWRFCRLSGVVHRVVSCWSLVGPAPPFCLVFGPYWTTSGLPRPVAASCPEALKGSKDGYFHHLQPGPGAHSTARDSTARCTSIPAEPDFGEQPCTDTLGFRAGGARHPPTGPTRHTCCSVASEGAAGQTFASWNRIEEWVRRLEQLRKVVWADERFGLRDRTGNRCGVYRRLRLWPVPVAARAAGTGPFPRPGFVIATSSCTGLPRKTGPTSRRMRRRRCSSPARCS